MKDLRLSILLVALSSSAAAHVAVVEEGTHPAKDSETRETPSQVVISFNGALESGLSGFTVVNELEETIAAGRVSSSDKTKLVAPLPKINPGTYIVHWKAVGMDSHRISGHYSFKILPKQ